MREKLMVIVLGRRTNMVISIKDLIQIDCIIWKGFKELPNFKIYELLNANVFNISVNYK